MAKSKQTREQLAAAGRKGGARTAELRRAGKLGQHTLPIADHAAVKAMVRDILKWKDE